MSNCGISGKSDIWNHFIKKDLGGTCKYCHQEVKTKGNTTNLRDHILRCHPTIKTVIGDTTLDIATVPGLQNVDNSDTESVASSTASASVLKQQTLTSCLTNIK